MHAEPISGSGLTDRDERLAGKTRIIFWGEGRPKKTAYSKYLDQARLSWQQEPLLCGARSADTSGDPLQGRGSHSTHFAAAKKLTL